MEKLDGRLLDYAVFRMIASTLLVFLSTLIHCRYFADKLWELAQRPVGLQLLTFSGTQESSGRLDPPLGIIPQLMAFSTPSGHWPPSPTLLA
ncbi:MAG: hypothetical protein ACP5OM_07720 [Methanothrix sp.]